MWISEMEKIRIRDPGKHPGSATLIWRFSFPLYLFAAKVLRRPS
jgi:hypothetical protein